MVRTEANALLFTPRHLICLLTACFSSSLLCSQSYKSAPLLFFSLISLFCDGSFFLYRCYQSIMRHVLCPILSINHAVAYFSCSLFPCSIVISHIHVTLLKINHMRAFYHVCCHQAIKQSAGSVCARLLLLCFLSINHVS